MSAVHLAAPTFDHSGLHLPPALEPSAAVAGDTSDVRVKLVSVKDLLDQPTIVLHLKRGIPYLIGRASRTGKASDATADSAFIDSPVVSRQHATMSIRGGLLESSVYIKDNNSMHGTKVNFRGIESEVDHQLVDGDVVEFDTFFPPQFHVSIGPVARRSDRPEGENSTYAVPELEDSMDASQRFPTVTSNVPVPGSKSNPVAINDDLTERPTVVVIEDDETSSNDGRSYTPTSRVAAVGSDDGAFDEDEIAGTPSRQGNPQDVQGNRLPIEPPQLLTKHHSPELALSDFSDDPSLYGYSSDSGDLRGEPGRSSGGDDSPSDDSNSSSDDDGSFDEDDVADDMSDHESSSDNSSRAASVCFEPHSPDAAVRNEPGMEDNELEAGPSDDNNSVASWVSHVNTSSLATSTRPVGALQSPFTSQTNLPGPSSLFPCASASKEAKGMYTFGLQAPLVKPDLGDEFTLSSCPYREGPFSLAYPPPPPPNMGKLPSIIGLSRAENNYTPIHSQKSGPNFHGFDTASIRAEPRRSTVSASGVFDLQKPKNGISITDIVESVPPAPAPASPTKAGSKRKADDFMADFDAQWPPASPEDISGPVPTAVVEPCVTADVARSEVSAPRPKKAKTMKMAATVLLTAITTFAALAIPPEGFYD